MNKRDKEAWARFHGKLIEENNKHTWYEIRDDVGTLHRLNMRLHTLAERSCNGDGWQRSRYWDEKDEKRFETSWNNAMAKVKAIFARYGEFEVTEQGDPRGWGMFEAKSKKTGRVFRVDW